MPRRVLESLKGVGQIYAGDELLRSTRYSLSVFQDDASAPLQVDGHIDITGIGEAVVLTGPQVLMLHLEDGRKAQVRLTDTGGAVIGTLDRGKTAAG